MPSNSTPLQKGLLFALTALLCSGSVSAQIVINEFTAANKNNHIDNFGQYEDWIELYNAGASSVNLQGYYLSDNLNNPTKWTIPNVNIAAGGFLRIFASDRNITTGTLHTNFKITQMRQEAVVLTDPSGNIIDSYVIVSPMQRNHSIGRDVNGGNAWKLYTNPTPGASNNPATEYDRYAQKPVFDLQSGFYPGSVTVSLSTEAGAEIRYTTNGTVPTTASTLYTGPITVNATQIVRARAFSPDPKVLPSFIENNTYFINESFTFPVVSVAGNFNTLFGSGTEIVSTFEYFENHQFVLESEGDMRGHGNDSWAFPQKGMRFYVRDQYGYTNKLEHPFFPTSPRTDFDVLILKGGASDNYPFSSTQWGRPSCHLRDVYSQTLSEKAGMHLDLRRNRHCILFLNGSYHGVYEIRERVDSDYTEYYYDQPESQVDMLRFWGWMNVEYGSAADWYALDNFIDNNSMTNPANYAYVESQMDLMSLIDYFILNTYTVNSDWLNWNSAWWRGRKAPGVRWKYWLWDMDNTFGLGQNYTGLGTTGSNNSPCDVNNLFLNDPDIAHTGMFVKLMQNDMFRDMYVNRYADLLNTHLSCDSVLAHFDALVAVLTPEMPRQIARWGGTMTGWQNNLTNMRNQIQGRCTVISQNFVNCYSPAISTPKTLTVNVQPAGAGNVRINTITPNSYPWTGSYFGGVNLSFKATAQPGYVFDHWEVNTAAAQPNTTADSMYIQFNAADNVVAVFMAQISLAGSTTNDNCNASGTGSITLTPGGGAQPYSFAWSNGATTQNLGGVVAGTYTVTLTDANGNNVVQSFTVNADPAPTVQASTDAPDCSGGNNGSIALTVSGGLPPYNFAWSNGSSSQDPGALPAGTYQLTLTDAAACTVTQSYTLLDGNNPQVALSATDAACFGDANGAVSVSVSGGTPPYSFAWSNGATTQNLNNLPAGSYTLQASDANGCTATAATTVQQPTALTLTLDITNATSGDDGSITAQVSGGTQPYSYLWNDPNAQTSATAAQLAAGTYTVLITDQNGCTASGSGEVLAGGIDCVKAIMTFTPNGDGVNDTWVLDCIFSLGNEVKVYNRWSQVVFSATNYDGTWDGGNLPDGAYFYLIEVDSPQTGKKTLKGSLNIIR